MQLLTDSPVLLHQSRLFSREPVGFDLTSAPKATQHLWSEFAGDARPWVLPWMDRQIPDGLAIVVGRANRSQFDQLVELSRGNVPLPAVVAVVALEGENFHGQRERPWQALLGNLHLSVYFRVDAPAAELREKITILPTLALMDTLELPADPAAGTGIRWMNDLFIRGRKVAGCLAASEVQGDELKAVLYGIGMNVEVTPQVPPTPFVRCAGSLREQMPEAGWTVAKAFSRLAPALHRRLEQLRDGRADGWVKEFVAASACVGRDVRIWPAATDDAGHASPVARGRLERINDDLSLQITGRSESVASGRCAFEEDCSALGL